MFVLHKIGRSWSLVAGALVLLLWRPFVAAADTIIDTTAIDATHTVDPISLWGPANTRQYGQVITVPTTDSVLESFSFTFNATGIFTYDADVAAWNNVEPTGASLFWSLQTTTDVGSDHTYTIDTGGLTLTGGAQYVLFFDARNGMGSGNATMDGRANNPYSGGGFVDANFLSSQKLTSPWDVSIGSGPTGVDAAFVAHFSAVPAPTAVWGCGALLMGFGVMTFVHRRLAIARVA